MTVRPLGLLGLATPKQRVGGGTVLAGQAAGGAQPAAQRFFPMPRALSASGCPVRNKPHSVFPVSIPAFDAASMTHRVADVVITVLVEVEGHKATGGGLAAQQYGLVRAKARRAGRVDGWGRVRARALAAWAWPARAAAAVRAPPLPAQPSLGAAAARWMRPAGRLGPLHRPCQSSHSNVWLCRVCQLSPAASLQRRNLYRNLYRRPT